MLQNPTVHPLDLAFKQAEQEISKNLHRYRQRPSNGYWGKVRNAGTFPVHKGTTIKGLKLPRVGMGPLTWSGIKDGLCETNLTDNDQSQRVFNPGWEEYSWSIQRASFDTDWINLETLVFREMPEEQLQHFEAELNKRAADVWDDKLRLEYLNACQNKTFAQLPRSVLTDGTCDNPAKYCDTSGLINDGFKFVIDPDVNGVPGQINPNYLLVKTPVADLDRIGTTTVDMIEEAALDMEFEDESRPAIADGIDLFDIVLPNVRIGRELFAQEDMEMGNAMSYGGYNPQLLQRKLGSRGVLRDRFSLRYDTFSLRYYPDTTYNAGLGAFDANNTATWPRLIRVFPYKPVQTTTGVKWVKNTAFVKAPFSIVTIFNPLVMDYQNYPEATSIGSLQKAGVGERINYAGNAVWINPDWPTNKRRMAGFFNVDIGMAARTQRPELGYAWLVRIDHRINLKALCCPLPSTQYYDNPTPYCYTNLDSDEAALAGQRGANAAIRWSGKFIA